MTRKDRAGAGLVKSREVTADRGLYSRPPHLGAAGVCGHFQCQAVRFGWLDHFFPGGTTGGATALVAVCGGAGTRGAVGKAL